MLFFSCTATADGFRFSLSEANDAVRSELALESPDTRRLLDNLEIQAQWGLEGYLPEGIAKLQAAWSKRPASSTDKLRLELLETQRDESSTLTDLDLEAVAHLGESDPDPEKRPSRKVARVFQSYDRLAREAVELPAELRSSMQIRIAAMEGLFALRVHDKTKASDAYARGTRAAEGRTGDAEVVLLDLLGGSLAIEKGDMEAAQRDLQRGLSILELDGIPDHPYAASIRPALVQAYVATKDVKRARATIQADLEFQYPRTPPIAYCSHAGEYAKSLYEIRANDDAEQTLFSAIDLVIRSKPLDAELLSSIIEDIEFALDGVSPDERLRVLGHWLADETGTLRQHQEYGLIVDDYAHALGTSGRGKEARDFLKMRQAGGEYDVAKDAVVMKAISSLAQIPPDKIDNLYLNLDEMWRMPGQLHFLSHIHVLDKAIERVRTAFPVWDGRIVRFVESKMDYYQAGGWPDFALKEAAKFRAELLTASDRDHIWARTELESLAQAVRKLGNTDEADEFAKAAAMEEGFQYNDQCTKAVGAMKGIECEIAAEWWVKNGDEPQGLEILVRYFRTSVSPEEGAIDRAVAGQHLKRTLSRTRLAPLASRVVSLNPTRTSVHLDVLCRGMRKEYGERRLSSDDPCSGLQIEQEKTRASATFEDEQMRLAGAIFLDPALQSALAATDSSPRERGRRLERLADRPEASRSSDERRVLLVEAWRSQLVARPRNDVTQALLLLKLADSYADELPDVALSLATASFHFLRDVHALDSTATLEPLTNLVSNAVGYGSPSNDWIALGLELTEAAFQQAAIDGSTSIQVAQLTMTIVNATPDPSRTVLPLMESKDFAAALAGSGQAPFLAQQLLEWASRDSRRSSLAKAYGVLAMLDRASVERPAEERFPIWVAMVKLANGLGMHREADATLRQIVSAAGSHAVPATLTELRGLSDRLSQADKSAEGLPKLEARIAELSSTSPWPEIHAAFLAAIRASTLAMRFGDAERLVNEVTLRVHEQPSAQVSDFDFQAFFQEIDGAIESSCRIAGDQVTVDFPIPVNDCIRTVLAVRRNELLSLTTPGVGRTRNRSAGRVELYLHDLSVYRQLPGVDASSIDAESALVVDYLASDQEQDWQSARRLITDPAGAMSALQGSLHRGEAFIVLHSSQSEIAGWLVSTEAVQRFASPISRTELGDLIYAARNGFFLPTDASELPAVNVDLLHRLYAACFLPIAERLRGIDEVYLSVHGSLALVPYATLVSGSAPANTWKPGFAWHPHWLIEDFALSLVRSANEFTHDRTAGNTPASKRLLAMGAPQLGRLGTPRTANADHDCIGDLPPLVGASDELSQSVRAAGGTSQVLQADDFTHQGLSSVDFSRFGHILVASHVVSAATRGCLVDDAAIVLSANDPSPLLTSREIAKLHLAADVVVISGCESASPEVGQETRSTGSLARAFFTAGSRAVIGTGWPLVSRLARHVTVPFFERMNGGQSAYPSRALRDVMLELIRGGDAELSHPITWAAFYSVGAT